MTLAEKLAQLRDLKLEYDPVMREIERLEREIKAEILETGEIPDVTGAKVTIRRGGESVRWNSKGLEGYAVAHPEIGAFMIVTERKPSVAIRIGLT